MRRSQDNIVAIRGRWGGIRAELAKTSVGPLECQDCLNLYVKGESLVTRPGVRVLTNSATNWFPSLAGTVYIRRLVALAFGTAHAQTRYLWAVATGNSAVPSARVFAQDGTAASGEFVFGAGATFPPSTEVINDVLYAVVGSWAHGRKFYRDGSLLWVAHRLGIPAPAGSNWSATAATGGALVDGTYSWRITLWNNDTATESAPADERTLTFASGGANNGRGVIGFNATGIDAQCSHWRLYRKRPSQTNWYYVTQQTVATTTYNDDGAAEDASVTGQLNLFGALGSSCDRIGYFARRAWYHVVGSDGVMHSEFDEPERVNPLNEYSVGDTDVTALVGALGYLWVFRRSATWVISGDGPEDFVASEISCQVGAISENAVREVNGRLYWCSDAGLHCWDGGEIRYLGEPVQPFFRRYHDAVNRLQDVTLTYEPRNGWLLITGIALISGQETPQTLVYDVAGERWFRWNLPCQAMTMFRGTLNSVDDNTDQPYFGIHKVGDSLHANVGTLRLDREVSAVGDFGSSIDYQWSSGLLDLGLSRPKRWLYLTPHWNQYLHAFTALSLNVIYQLGPDANPVYPGLPSPALNTRSRRPYRIGRRSQRLLFALSGAINAAMPLELSGVDIEAVPCGAR